MLQLVKWVETTICNDWLLSFNKLQLIELKRAFYIRPITFNMSNGLFQHSTWHGTRTVATCVDQHMLNPACIISFFLSVQSQNFHATLKMKTYGRPGHALWWRLMRMLGRLYRKPTVKTTGVWIEEYQCANSLNFNSRIRRFAQIWIPKLIVNFWDATKI